MGDLASLKAFAIVILGGLGNIAGATIGGFILAFAEELGAGYISSGYRDAMGFLLIIVVLLFKPTGSVRARGAGRMKRVLAGSRWLAAGVTVPLWLQDQYLLHVLIITGIFIIAAMSLNLLLGYTGQLSLGHVAFFGIGAYASALTALGFDVDLVGGIRVVHEPWPVWLGFVIAALVVAELCGYVDRQALVQGARRLLRHRHHQLRRGRAARRAELGGADARPAGAHQHPAVDARVARARLVRRSAARPSNYYLVLGRGCRCLRHHQPAGEFAHRPRHDRAQGERVAGGLGRHRRHALSRARRRRLGGDGRRGRQPLRALLRRSSIPTSSCSSTR